jgi:hypothetical protein
MQQQLFATMEKNLGFALKEGRAHLVYSTG